MTTYGIIANCNFETRDDETGAAIHDARKAVESGLTDDATLVAALDDLEAVLSDHADDGGERSVRLCSEAEQAVVDVWTDEVQAAAEKARLSRYVD